MEQFIENSAQYRLEEAELLPPAKKKSRFLPLKIALICVAVLISLVLILVGYAVCSLTNTLSNIERLDSNGNMYLGVYTGDLDSPILKMFPSIISQIGCSCFTAKNTDGDIITGRNYDFPHTDSDGNLVNCDLMVRFNPVGKYSSINTCDLAMFNIVGGEFKAGCLDDMSLKNNLLLGLVPDVCEDGINETGLSAAILFVDTKEGEHAPEQNEAGKSQTVAPRLLRDILDNCQTVEDAWALASKYNMVSCLHCDFHIYVSDANGAHGVLEWRNDQLKFIDTDVCTNFYVGSDDAADYYQNGNLMEKYTPLVSKYNTYHMGYGHGYSRFAKIVQTLDEYRSAPAQLATMTNCDARSLLQQVSQAYNPELKTSATLWSLLFNNTDKTIDVMVNRDYTTFHRLGFQ